MVDGRCEPQREVTDGFPRAAGTVVFAEAAGDEVEILFLRAAAFLQDAVEVVAILADAGSSPTASSGGTEQGQDLGGQVVRRE
jgi:hypothetical protein